MNQLTIPYYIEGNYAFYEKIKIMKITEIQTRFESILEIENLIHGALPWCTSYKKDQWISDEKANLYRAVQSLVYEELGGVERPELSKPSEGETPTCYHARLLKGLGEVKGKADKKIAKELSWYMSGNVKMSKGRAVVNVETYSDSYSTDQYSYNSIEKIEKIMKSINYIYGLNLENPIGRNDEIESRKIFELDGGVGFQTYKKKVAFLLPSKIAISIQKFVYKNK